MENQTRFDLNAALEKWQAELAAQPSLSAENRRELETHLRDTFAELKARGLSEEESFWLACRRGGQPQQLAAEFVKDYPTQAWRERLFWLMLTLLAIRLWNMIVGSLTTPFLIRSIPSKLGDRLPQWVSFYLPAWVNDLRTSSIFVSFYETINFLFVLTIVFLLVRGKNQKFKAPMDFVLKSRTRFLFYLLALVTFDYVASSSIWNALTAQTQFHSNFFFVFLNQGAGSLCLIALVVWLMPAQNRPAPKRV
jgi:hypothetical protein